jgi:arsenate reductase-like glutaredoxin family protein
MSLKNEKYEVSDVKTTRIKREHITESIEKIVNDGLDEFLKQIDVFFGELEKEQEDNIENQELVFHLLSICIYCYYCLTKRCQK